MIWPAVIFLAVWAGLAARRWVRARLAPPRGIPGAFCSECGAGFLEQAGVVVHHRMAHEEHAGAVSAELERRGRRYPERNHEIARRGQDAGADVIVIAGGVAVRAYRGRRRAS